VEVEPTTQTTLYVYFLKAPFSDEEPFVEPDLRGQFDASAISITGGEKVKRVRVEPFEPENANWETDAAGQPRLRLHVEAPGDFSPYTLRIASSLLDPYFDHVTCSFKAACPSDLDCKPPLPVCPPLKEEAVVIDYLAKDYQSFRQALLDFATLYHPEWQERSEADVGMVLLEAMAALADELSYYQDRVAAEAFLETATQRQSVRHHARLIDYAMHEGHAARAWLAFQVTGNTAVEAGTTVWGRTSTGESVVFEIGEGLHDDAIYVVFPEGNELRPYYWDETDRCLQRGATEMYVEGHGLHLGEGQFILIESIPTIPSEHPKRQMVQLVKLADDEPAEVSDPLYAKSLTRIRWAEDDALHTDFDLAQTVVCAHLLPATQGKRMPPESFAIGTPPPASPQMTLATERTGPNGSLSLRYALRHGPLTHLAPQSARGTGRAAPAQQALQDIARQARPEIDLRESLSGRVWCYRPDLLGSEPFDEHFTLDYANDGSATIRFGDGVFGRLPTTGTVFEVTYRVGQGAIGNVPPDTLTEFRPEDFPPDTSVRNPLPAQGGVDPESLTDVWRLAPFAFRAVTYRAVRPEDYRLLVERDLPWVSRANAALRWTGSWLTAFVTADPRGTDDIRPEQHDALRQLVHRYRMAGTEAYELAPLYANLDVEITVCAQPDAFRGDVKARVLAALSSGTLPGQPKGFFHPDYFTFGMPLYRSRLEAAIQAVPGVMGVRRMRVRRRGFVEFPADPLADNLPEVFEVADNEVIRVMNDPNRPERGSLTIRMEGGK
jgi:hypothetical protein